MLFYASKSGERMHKEKGKEGMLYQAERIKDPCPVRVRCLKGQEW